MLLPASLLLLPLLLAHDSPTTGPAWELARTHEFAIATPTGFQRKPQSGPTMVLHVGNERTDEHGQPLRVGITVERVPDRPTPDPLDIARKLVDQYRQDGTFQIIGDPVIEPIRLADGSPAAWVRVEAYRGADRRTVIGKIVSGRGNTRWIASAFVTAGRDSTLCGADGAAFGQLDRHLRTFTLDPGAFDATKLDAAEAPATQPQ